MKFDLYLSPYTKVSAKWIKDLNVKSETLKLMEKWEGHTLPDKGTEEDFLNRLPCF